MISGGEWSEQFGANWYPDSHVIWLANWGYEATNTLQKKEIKSQNMVI